MVWKYDLLDYQKGWRVLRTPSRGFSLIELMVGLAVVAVLLVAAVPSFSTFIQNRKVRSAAEAVVYGLNIAKAEAVRRNTSVSIAVDAASGWTVGCASTSTTCPGTIQQRDGADGTSNITTTAASFTFNGYGLVTSLSAGSSTTIDVTNALGTCEHVAATGKIRCLKIVVNSGGQVRMCDTKLTSTNPSSPQAC